MPIGYIKFPSMRGTKGLTVETQDANGKINGSGKCPNLQCTGSFYARTVR